MQLRGRVSRRRAGEGVWREGEQELSRRVGRAVSGCQWRQPQTGSGCCGYVA